MQKFALTIAALTLSSAALADISTGASDLYGWVVEDHAIQTSGRLHRGENDLYGNIALYPDAGGSDSTTPAQIGLGDASGSILHRVGFAF